MKPASNDTHPAKLSFFYHYEFCGTSGSHRTWVCLLDMFPERKAARVCKVLCQFRPLLLSTLRASKDPCQSLRSHDTSCVGESVRAPLFLLGRQTDSFLPFFLHPQRHVKCWWVFFREMKVKSVISRKILLNKLALGTTSLADSFVFKFHQVNRALCVLVLKLLLSPSALPSLQ